MLPSLTVFDIETTGLDPRRGHRIIEIAGVKIENGAIMKDASFVSLVNPEREIPLEARQVHKITDADVSGAPGIEVVLPKFLEFAKGSILVAHNASFDMSFLEMEKQLCWGYLELPECLCSMQLYKSIFPREFRWNLDIVSQKFNLQRPVNRHRALDDVLLTAEAILKMLEAGNIRSMDELRRRAGFGQLIK
jgi:DNA polymerase-3 subunit epsilon